MSLSVDLLAPPRPVFARATGFRAAARADIGAGDDLLDDILSCPLFAPVEGGPGDCEVPREESPLIVVFSLGVLRVGVCDCDGTSLRAFDAIFAHVKMLPGG